MVECRDCRQVTGASLVPSTPPERQNRPITISTPHNIRILDNHLFMNGARLLCRQCSPKTHNTHWLHNHTPTQTRRRQQASTQSLFQTPRLRPPTDLLGTTTARRLSLHRSPTLKPVTRHHQSASPYPLAGTACTIRWVAVYTLKRMRRPQGGPLLPPLPPPLPPTQQQQQQRGLLGEGVTQST